MIASQAEIYIRSIIKSIKYSSSHILEITYNNLPDYADYINILSEKIPNYMFGECSPTTRDHDLEAITWHLQERLTSQVSRIKPLLSLTVRFRTRLNAAQAVSSADQP